jgi:hypothetical protein
MILGCAMISRGEIGLLSVSSSEHLAPL